MASGENFQLFNLATMSGVFPGTRTMVFQRIRVSVGHGGDSLVEPVVRWMRVLWYADPAACVIEPDAGGALEPGAAVVRIPEPQQPDFPARLQAAMTAAGWQLHACGSCAFWELAAAATADGLALGRCRWQPTPPNVTATPAPLQLQSLLALDCSHWQAAPDRPPTVPAAPESPAPAAETVAPMRKRAEQENDERWTLLGQLRRRLRRQSALPAPAGQTWADRLVERSGVGAGTETCFACQGRIANLGALAVATPEGDKQTFSVWRCRLCYTYYLNDWIDRWERTDSLETEERYYRLAPAEAIEVLAVIDNVVHAEHPARRHERDAQRRWMHDFIGARPPLSHQIKQGR